MRNQSNEVAVDPEIINAMNASTIAAPEQSMIDYEEMMDEFAQLLECGFTTSELARHISAETGLDFNDVLTYIS